MNRSWRWDGKRRLWGPPPEIVLMLAFGESGTVERSRNRLMRWRRREKSVNDLAREPGLCEQKDYRLGDMPRPVHPSSSAQPLFGSKRSRDGPAPSHSVDSPIAAPPSKKVRMNEIEIQTAETSETLKKGTKTGKHCALSLMNTKRKRKIVTNGRESKTSYRSLSRRRR